MTIILRAQCLKKIFRSEHKLFRLPPLRLWRENLSPFALALHVRRCETFLFRGQGGYFPSLHSLLAHVLFASCHCPGQASFVRPALAHSLSHSREQAMLRECACGCWGVAC